MKSNDQTGMNRSLISKKKAALELKKVSKKVPVREVKSKKDLKEFFDEK